MKKTWSIKAIQDLSLDEEEWEKKNLYATDTIDKCHRGLYYALKGYKKTSEIEPENLRRMEVGKMIELNQIKKLKSLGIFLGTQDRLYDEECKVSGRLDALLVSPDQCTPKIKKLIARKKEIYNDLDRYGKNLWKGIDDYNKGEISEGEFLKGKQSIMEAQHQFYNMEREIDKIILDEANNKANSFMVVEVKSMNEWGFKYRQAEGTPMDTHHDQALFYLWKLKERFANIVARILYVQIPYQNLLEFDVPYNEQRLNEMKAFWKDLNRCVEQNRSPELAPPVIYSEKTKKYQVNKAAEWCNYHELCTGDKGWLDKALVEVKKLNLKSKK